MEELPPRKTQAPTNSTVFFECPCVSLILVTNRRREEGTSTLQPHLGGGAKREERRGGVDVVT